MSENGMGISRRVFVAGAGATALGVGLAGGIVGCAPGTEKESEHTAGVEKTAYDPKAGEWIPTTCNMCFNNCSIKAHVIDGVVVELTGNPDSSIGRGHICGKGASGIMQLYDPNRITKPLLLLGRERGAHRGARPARRGGDPRTRRVHSQRTARRARHRRYLQAARGSG